MSDTRARPVASNPGQPTLAQPATRQPSLASYALGLLVGCCLCASLIASLG